VIAIGLLVLIPGCIYGLWRALPFSAAQRQGWAGVWRLAGVIAAVRVSLLGIGVLSLRSSDWAQGMGYFMLIPAGLPGIYAARALRSNTTEWFAVCCALLAASSFLWAALFRLPCRAPMKQADEHPKN
jgi:hypothetical protein